MTHFQPRAMQCSLLLLAVAALALSGAPAVAQGVAPDSIARSSASWSTGTRSVAARGSADGVDTLPAGSGIRRRDTVLGLAAPSDRCDASRGDSRAACETKTPTLGGTANYVLPALEILGFDTLVNRVNRCCGSQRDDYAVSLSSIRRNLHHSWVVDDDPFQVNQFGHPYQGSIYHGFARANGLDYWTAAAYTFAGSAAWEIAGERTPPSRNDQVSTGIGGTFLGEALFRMANLVLDKDMGVSPRWREWVAAGISPATGFNRMVMHETGDPHAVSGDGDYYSQLRLGVAGSAEDRRGSSTVHARNEVQGDYALEYGLPGKDGYTYRRPFDYFAFHATVSSANGLENVLTRGLLFGAPMKAGATYRGIWGLYGSYDYISPQTFRISSTALSLGTTGQWKASDAIAMQGSALAGVGYAAVSTLRGVPTDRDYHYGVTPQTLLALRVIFGDRASFDITGREYFVSRAGGLNRGGHDNILRADIGLTFRIRDHQAISVRYLWNRRDAEYPDLGDRSQTRGSVGVYYTVLGQDNFGRADWTR